jgi:hypothetical protein
MTLEDRINRAEKLADQGASVSQIMMETGLTRHTADCVRARVTGQSSFDGLKKCAKEDRS